MEWRIRHRRAICRRQIVHPCPTGAGAARDIERRRRPVQIQPNGNGSLVLLPIEELCDAPAGIVVYAGRPTYFDEARKRAVRLSMPQLPQDRVIVCHAELHKRFRRRRWRRCSHCGWRANLFAVDGGRTSPGERVFQTRLARWPVGVFDHVPADAHMAHAGAGAMNGVLGRSSRRFQRRQLRSDLLVWRCHYRCSALRVNDEREALMVVAAHRDLDLSPRSAGLSAASPDDPDMRLEQVVLGDVYVRAG